MGYERTDRLSETLRKHVAEFVEEHFRGEGIITLTRLELPKNLKTCTVFFSVYPPEHETRLMRRIEGVASDIRMHVKNKMKTKFTPFFTFMPDKGERERQKMEELFRRIDI